ncbi:MAG: nucleoside hydrolase [Eubacteriales bacterium]
MKKILFDTDIGSDIDDALALAYLLREPECELLGITTVSGQPVERAKLASAICRAAGRDDIPIYPGLEGPILGRQLQPRAAQAEKLCNWSHREEFGMFSAVEFMRRTIRENPGEVTLLAVGPMTNVAALFLLDPEIPSLLDSLVLMCGDFGEGTTRNEWNSKCDWAATACIYGKKVRLHRSFGLNVTLLLTLEREEVERNFRADIMAPVKDFAYTWFAGGGKRMVFHDPLAALSIFHPEVCGYKRGNATICTDRPGSLGYSTFEENEDGMHEIAVTVDKERFFTLYFDTVNS